MFESEAQTVVARLREKNMTVAFAESCTGGMLAAALTAVSGASDVFAFGGVTYSNEMKEKLLGVRHETLAVHGAVSAQTAEQMAQGILQFSGAYIGVSITGIAGPNSDNTAKPVGLIYVCVKACDGYSRVVELRNNFTEHIRENNRCSAVRTALDLLNEYLTR
ncbi:MAG: CinA family protein [Clostridia bacterium]|nr:CinA family protein [Clostridia bacterium]